MLLRVAEHSSPYLNSDTGKGLEGASKILGEFAMGGQLERLEEARSKLPSH